MACGVEIPSFLTPKMVKDNHKYFPVPHQELWRVDLILELMETRSQKCNIGDFTMIIDDVCTS